MTEEFLLVKSIAPAASLRANKQQDEFHQGIQSKRQTTSTHKVAVWLLLYNNNYHYYHVLLLPLHIFALTRLQRQVEKMNQKGDRFGVA